jgi:ATP-dependent DNA ligase
LKKLTSRYKSGSCRSWLKVKNPDYEEARLCAGWVEEHTLGARIRNWRLVELNGSVRGV